MSGSWRSRYEYSLPNGVSPEAVVLGKRKKNYKKTLEKNISEKKRKF